MTGRSLRSNRTGTVVLVLLGVGGAVVLALWAPINQTLVAASGLPEQTLRLISILYDIAVLTVAIIVGALLSRRVGLQSVIAHKNAIRFGFLNAAARAILIGLALGFGVYALDWGMFQFVPGLSQLTQGQIEIIEIDWPVLSAQMLHGGLTEEITMRWGLMSLLAWLLLKFIPRHDTALWAAIALTALIYGLGHLPALYQIMGDAPAILVIRTVGLNFIAGMVFGYLFWSRNLEAAMLAHGATLIGTATAQAILI